MSVRKVLNRGFTLIEILFTMTMVVILAAISLWSLRPGDAKAPSQGMAMALAEELSAARQLAISSGRPVALGIPTNNGGRPAASSIYRLEGWNTPNITWSKGFSGDYPGLGFAAVQWSGGGTWTTGATQSVVTKLGAFKLVQQWLPDDTKKDYIFCFTPDGGLVTNNLRAVDDRFPIVVGRNLSLSEGGGTASATLNGAGSPYTLLVSPYGGVEIFAGVPGATIGSGGNSSVTSNPVQRTEFDDAGIVIISNILVRPTLEPGGADDKGYCVPGQVVTMEVYAYDPEGRGLYAKWKQPGNKGIFTYPDGRAPSGSPFADSEADRMEFVQETPSDVTWSGTGASPPPGGVFRARWSWTVPLNSSPGDTYGVEVDVKDAKGQCEIINRPDPVVLEVEPAGNIIAERQIGGVWQLVRLKQNGRGEVVLSPPGVEETMATIDDDGQQMSFLQGPAGNRSVMIRDLTGGRQRKIAGPGDFTSLSMSPDGTWVSFTTSGGNLRTQKVDNSVAYTDNQNWQGTLAAGGVRRSRSGWTADSAFVFYEQGTSLKWRNLRTGATGDLVTAVDNGGVIESLYAPTTYKLSGSGQERVMFSMGNVNPVLLSVPVVRSGGSIVRQGDANGKSYISSSAPVYTATPGGNALGFMKPDLDGGGGSAGSTFFDDSYPSISADGKFLFISQSPIGQGLETQQTSLLLPHRNSGPGAANFVGPSSVSLGGNTRRAVWIP